MRKLIITAALLLSTAGAFGYTDPVFSGAYDAQFRNQVGKWNVIGTFYEEDGDVICNAGVDLPEGTVDVYYHYYGQTYDVVFTRVVDQPNAEALIEVVSQETVEETLLEEEIGGSQELLLEFNRCVASFSSEGGEDSEGD